MLDRISWQLFEISDQYLKYKVNSRTTVFIPKILEELSMGMCLRVYYAIDYDKFNTEFQHNWTSYEFAEKGMLNNLSLNRIYNYTYDAEDLLYDEDFLRDLRSRDPLYSYTSIIEARNFFSTRISVTFIHLDLQAFKNTTDYRGQCYYSYI